MTERKVTLEDFEKVGWCPIEDASDELLEECLKTGYIGCFISACVITSAASDEGE